MNSHCLQALRDELDRERDKTQPDHQVGSILIQNKLP